MLKHNCKESKKEKGKKERNY